MSRILARQQWLAGFAGAGLWLCAAGLVLAQQSDWNGTWAGDFQAGHAVQLIFAGNDLIGVYWEDDYVSDARGSVSNDGASVAITWAGVSAVLTRDGPAAAHIVLRETGRPDTTFPLKRDQ